MGTMDNYLSATVRIQTTVPATLYHYCSTDRLHFLLEPGADLCCRNLTCQGDREEYRFGAKLLCDYIRHKGSVYRGAGDVIESNLAGNIGCVGQKIIGTKIPLTFSPTEKIDSEYHYREYCKGNGCAIAFDQAKLDEACNEVVKQGVSLRLIRCYYEEKDATEIATLCEAFWQDQCQNIDCLLRSNYTDERAGKSVLSAICSIAPHFKRKDYFYDNEWRLVMIVNECDGINDRGFKAGGLRDATPHGDLVDLMEGVAVRRGETHAAAMRELSRLALQQRKRDFEVII